jgi:GDP-L-fucose synthase
MVSKQKILICGATGFIGRNLVVQLSKISQYKITAVYHKRPAFHCDNVEWVYADLTNKQDVEKIVDSQDVIIQAAATTSGAKDIATRPMIHVTDNMIINSLIFRAAHEANVAHVLFFSCTVMYQTSNIPLKESDLDLNNPLYSKYFGVGWMKISTEKQCEFYASLGKTKYTVMRHSNIYGPHDKYDLEHSHFFGATITKVMTAEDEIVVWGSGEEARDLLYIDDLASFVTLAIEKQTAPFGLYNVGYGEAFAVKDVVAKIVEHSNKQLVIKHDLTKPTMKTSLCLDCSKAKSELGWQRKTSLDSGIQKTLSWYKANMLTELKESLNE